MKNIFKRRVRRNYSSLIFNALPSVPHAGIVVAWQRSREANQNDGVNGLAGKPPQNP